MLRKPRHKQGYLFHEWVNTFEINDKVAINLNPKMVSSGKGSLYSFGLSSNIKLSKLYELILESNISMSQLSKTNSTFAIRKLFTDHLYIDLYLSSAAGLQDLGQMLSSNEIRKGIKFNLSF